MMNKNEFKKYIKRKSMDLKSIANELKSMFKEDSRIDRIYVPENWIGTIVLSLNKVLLEFVMYGRHDNVKQIWIRNEMYVGRVKIGISFGINNISEYLTDDVSDVELFRDAIKRVIDDPESFVIKQNPRNIQYLLNPSKKAQEEVISKDPKNFLLINNPDLEIEKKYKYLRSLSRSGIVK